MKYLLPAGGVSDTRFGILTAPNHRGIVKGIVDGLPWAADLGCLFGPSYIKPFDNNNYAWLEKMTPYRSTCLFISGYDVVGDAARTLAAFSEFVSMMNGWPVAFVAQDGQENLPLPDGDWTTLFIGGSTEWKDGVGAVDCIRRAQAMGKRIHIGRVNEWARFSKFSTLPGNEEFTCDGTKQRFVGVQKAIRHYARHMDRAERQVCFDLFGGGSGSEFDDG